MHTFPTNIIENFQVHLKKVSFLRGKSSVPDKYVYPIEY